VSRLLVRDLAQLATPSGSDAPLRGEMLGRIEVVEDAYIVIHEGRIEHIGRMRDLPELDGDVAEVDGRGLAAIPGLVDCHTHPAFAGDPVEEFSLRAGGATYDELLADESRVIRPKTGKHNTHVFHIYAVRVKNRDEVLQRMAARGVNCAIHYPVPIHLQKAYAFLGHGPGSFPVSEQCSQEFLSLPMYPELQPDQINFVVKTLKECLSE